MKKLIKKIMLPFIKRANEDFLIKYYKDNKIDDKKYEILNDISGKNILVLAPHQDDESIGLGATISMLSKKNKVHILYATDGRLKINNGFPDNIDEIRKEEALIISKKLGVSIEFLNYVNTDLRDNYDNLKEDIKKRIFDDRFIFDFIFSTSISECTEDHRVLTEVLLEIVRDKRNSNDAPMIYLYDINMSIPPHSINAITVLHKDDIDLLKDIYSVFKSQIYMEFDHISMIDRAKGNLIIADNKKGDICGAEIFYKVKNPASLIEKLGDSSRFNSMRASISKVGCMRFLKIFKENEKNFYDDINKLYEEK